MNFSERLSKVTAQLKQMPIKFTSCLVGVVQYKENTPTHSASLVCVIYILYSIYVYTFFMSILTVFFFNPV